MLFFLLKWRKPTPGEKKKSCLTGNDSTTGESRTAAARMGARRGRWNETKSVSPVKQDKSPNGASDGRVGGCGREVEEGRGGTAVERTVLSLVRLIR